jgi:hypothetical protein
VAIPDQPVPDDQRYTVDSAIEVAGDFAHNTIVALGGPETSTTGYTMQSWATKQREYVKWCRKQSDAVMPDLLKHADGLGRRAMALMAREFRLYKNTDQPHLARCPHLMAFGEEFDSAIAERKAAAAPLVTVQRAFPGLVAASEPRSLPGVMLTPAKKSEAVSLISTGVTPPQPGVNTTPAPGSKKAWASWKDNGKLQIGNDLIDIIKYSKEQLKLSKDEALKFCWPVIACRSMGPAKLAFCPCPDEAGHQGLQAKAHVAPKGYDSEILAKNYREWVKFSNNYLKSNPKKRKIFK